MRAVRACCTIIAAAVLAAGAARGQNVGVITSFQANGRVAWTAPSGSVCTVEWNNRLGGTQEWRGTWNSLRGVLMTATSAAVDVPMFYRVICDTDPLSMITPYVSESDMHWARQGYSEVTNCPWGFIHEGIDFQPTTSLAPFRAVCDGTIMDVVLRHAPPSDGGRQNWDVFVELRYDDNWAVTYNFEPKTTNLSDGIIQITNIAVSLLQEVSQGDLIGYLHMGDPTAHVHFSVVKHGYMFHNGLIVCPEPFFTPAARTSVLNVLHVRYPGADMCY